MAAVETDPDYAAARLAQVDGRIADLEAELEGLKEKRANYAPAKRSRAKADES